MILLLKAGNYYWEADVNCANLRNLTFNKYCIINENIKPRVIGLIESTTEPVDQEDPHKFRPEVKLPKNNFVFIL